MVTFRAARFAVLALALSACAHAAPIGATVIATPSTAPTVAPTPAATPAATAALATAAPQRLVVGEEWVPFARTGDVELRFPTSRVERVGFHQASHDGAQQLEQLPGIVNPVLLPDRHRNTGRRSAADVVSDPTVEVRSPVSGRVKRGGTYTLYCKYSDVFVVIEPDSHPGWEVKALHMVGMRVHVGDRVTAGETVIADHPRKLPFESDVDVYDERLKLAPWPHIHIEVVDPSIRNKPSPGEGCK